jgi:hypothetical protein
MLTIKITITPLPIITNLVFYSKLNYEIGTAYNIGKLCFMKLVMIKAMNQILAINLLEKNKDYYISDYLTYMSDIYIKQNKPDKALEYASRSLKLAQNTDSRNK